MSSFQFIILIFTGLAAGLLSGSLGVGGLIIMVPAMVYFLDLTQHQAQGTALAVMLLPVVLPSVFQYYKNGNLNIYFSVLLMVGFVVGSYFGAMLANQIPVKTLQKVFAVFLIILGLKMFFTK